MKTEKCAAVHFYATIQICIKNPKDEKEKHRGKLKIEKKDFTNTQLRFTLSSSANHAFDFAGHAFC